MSVTIDSVLVQDKTLNTAVLDGYVVVLSLNAGSYFGFNPVASEIWTMLAEPCRMDRIFEALLQNHDVDAAALAREVTPFLELLVEQGLAQVIHPGEVR